MDAGWIVTMIMVVIFGEAYLAFLYFKFRWQLIDVMLMTMGGSILPALFARAIREDRHAEVVKVVTGVIVLFVVSQLIIVPATLVGIEWAERLKITSTFKRVALIVYAWTLMPALLAFMIAVFGVMNPSYTTQCLATIILTALLMLPAARLTRESGKPVTRAAQDPPPQAP